MVMKQVGKPYKKAGVGSGLGKTVYSLQLKHLEALRLLKIFSDYLKAV